MAPMNIFLSLLAIWLPKMTAIRLPEMNAAPDYKQSVKSPRIVGGQDAVEGSWPWQAAIFRDNFYICGGSLIDDQWVLSAAHCINESYSDEQYTILLGAHHLQEESHNVAFRSVQRIFLHPNYDKVTKVADIALLKLDSPVKFSSRIRPISLQRVFQDFSNNTDCWVTGWGWIKQNEVLPYPATLQQLKVKIITRELCNILYTRVGFMKDFVKEDMLCAASYPSEGKGSPCMGDSGGPLVCRNKGVWTQVGIVSWGDGSCGEPFRPGGYISVLYYDNWIDSTISRG